MIAGFSRAPQRKSRLLAVDLKILLDMLEKIFEIVKAGNKERTRVRGTCKGALRNEALWQ